MDVGVRILGSFELTVGGRPLVLSSPMQRVVLSVLALRAGRPTSADLLIDVLWDDEPPPSARTSLQAHVSRLRRTLREHGAPQVLVGRPDGYLLDVPAAAVDALALEERIRQGRAALDGGDPVAASAILGDALQSWRGEPLSDLGDRAWGVANRARLATLHFEAAELRCRADLEADRVDAAITDLEALVAVHPFRERLWALLMRALRRAGREAEALQTFERARRTIAEELGIDPGTELRALHEELLRQDGDLGRRPGEPVADAPRRAASHLPSPLTSFVGRRAEVADLARLLDERRLVTIVGTGGAGKTRLAIEVAGRVAQRFGDGVWFVDLTAIDAPAHVVEMIATTLGVREAAGQPLIERLTGVLRDAQLLLVLDNCEHVVTAGAEVAERLLSSCPGLRILATSREPLAVTGEVRWQLGGLSVSDGAASDVTATEDAVALLVQRITDVDPAYAVTDVALHQARELCHRLDGLPLAIEIAAAQVRTMSLEHLADRLLDGAGMPPSGARAAPDRHRSLEAAIRWSCDQLDEADRALLGCLAVFPGTFCAEAAVEVAASDGDTEAGLARLVGRSLLTVRIEGGEHRFRLLETIRAYARRYLDTGDAAMVRGRLHGWVQGLIDAAAPALIGAEQQRWLERLDREHDNLRVALEHAAADDRLSVAALALPLLWYWIKRGRMVEGESWIARAVAAAPDGTPERARALNAWSIALENTEGPSPKLDAVVEEAARLARAIDDPRELAWSACWGGLIAVWSDLDAAQAALADSRRRFGGLGAPHGHALAGMYLAFVERVRGDYAAADRLAVGAEAEFARLGESWGVAMSRMMRGMVARYTGDHDRGRVLLAEALETCTALDSPDGAIGALLGLALIAETEGDLPRALASFDRALDLARRAGSTSLIAETLVARAWTLWLVGDVAASMAAMDEFANDHGMCQYDRCVAAALDLAAHLVAAGRAPGDAIALHGCAARVRERLRERPRPELRVRVDAALEHLRDRVTAADFAQAWTRGVADPDALTTLRVTLRGLDPIRPELVASLSPSGGAPPDDGAGPSVRDRAR